MTYKNFSSVIRPSMLALAVSLALPSAGHAQDNVVEDESAISGDIVVTARKTNERLQDVPMSVNAVSTDQLRDRGAADVKDVLRAIPGFSFSGTERGLSNYNIRGVSTVASAPTVGIYLDDISLVTIATAFSGAFDPIFFDVERLEVLKGPQGTLYGGSSMGGAIKYVSARPKIDEFSVSTAAGLAFTEKGSPTYNGEVVANIPVIADRLAVRAGFLYRHDGGYVDNAPGDIQNSRFSSTAFPAYTPLLQDALSNRTIDNKNFGDTYAARISVEWQPDPSWSIRPQIFFQDYKQADTGQFFINQSELKASTRISQPTYDTAGIYSLNIDKDLGGVRVTALTGYFDRTLSFVRDYSFFLGNLVAPLYPLTSRNVSDSYVKTFSQEVRIASNNPGASFKWLVGLYYSDQDDRLVQAVTTPGATPIIGTELGYFGDTTTKSKQYAAFGEASYALFENFEVTAGVRVFKIDQVVDIFGDGPLNGGVTQINDRRSKEDGINPKVGISYKVTPDNLVYASAAKGFRPGGPNRFQINPVLCASDLATLGLTAAPDTFSSDNLWSYELGTKNMFSGNRVMLNASAFYTDWKKIQQQINLTSCGFNFTGNAGSAEIKGLELESRFNITPAFQIGGTGTYTDATITEAVPGTTAQSGDEVQAVPKWMASAFASYRFELGNDWRLNMRGEYQYQSRSRRQFDRTQAVRYLGSSPVVNGTGVNRAEFRESYQVVNTFASLTRNDTELRVYVNNLLDTRPLIDLNLTSGVDTATTIRPRTIGMEIRQRF